MVIKINCKNIREIFRECKINESISLKIEKTDFESNLHAETATFKLQNL